MSLLTFIVALVVALVVVGVALWLINTYIPMDGKIKKILNVAVVAIVIFWLLQASGILATLENIHIG